MSRVKTFDSTGIAPGGVLYAGDLNAIQDQYADLVNLSQNLSVAILSVGEAGLQLSRYATGVLRISGQLRTDGIINSVTGFQVNGVALAASHLSDGISGTGQLAKVSSPTFLGSPLAPTPAVNTNTQQLATTAFVIGQASAALPAAPGAAAAGTSTQFARGDHVHPTDPLKAPLASPVLTGAPVAPTAAVTDSSTTLATTAFVRSIVPPGIFLPYVGAAAPAGWLLCDGLAYSRATYAALFAVIGTVYGAGDGTTTFNVPNMQGRIPVGKNAGTFTAMGSSGGVETVALITANIPSHTHSGTVNAETTDHTHSGTTDAETQDHSHSGTTAPGGVGGKELNATAALNVGTQGTTFQGPTNALLADSHQHSFSTGGRSAAHNHTFGTGGRSASHTHTFTTDGGSGTTGTAHTNLQPYLVSTYIIKT